MLRQSEVTQQGIKMRRSKYKLLMLFSVFLSTLVGAIQLTYGQVNLDLYRSPSYVANRTFIVCSDEPEVHIKQIRVLAEFISGGLSYSIEDGRYFNGEFDESSVTLAYFGHAKESVESRDCMRRFPKLEAYFREAVDRQLDRNLLSKSFQEIDATNGKIKMILGICYLEGELCAQEYYPILFGFDPRVCFEYQICFSVDKKGV